LKRPDGIAGSERKLGELEKYSRSIDDQLEGQTRWTAVGKTIMSTAPCVFSCLCKILDTKKDFEAKIAEIDQAIKLEGEVIKKGCNLKSRHDICLTFANSNGSLYI
jgi:hypothetical protein